MNQIKYAGTSELLKLLKNQTFRSKFKELDHCWQNNDWLNFYVKFLCIFLFSMNFKLSDSLFIVHDFKTFRCFAIDYEFKTLKQKRLLDITRIRTNKLLDNIFV